MDSSFLLTGRDRGHTFKQAPGAATNHINARFHDGSGIVRAFVLRDSRGILSID